MKTKLSLLVFLAGFLMLMTVQGKSETNYLEDYEEYSSEEINTLSNKHKTSPTKEMSDEISEEEFNKHVASLEENTLPEEISPEDPPIEPESP